MFLYLTCIVSLSTTPSSTIHKTGSELPVVGVEQTEVTDVSTVRAPGAWPLGPRLHPLSHRHGGPAVLRQASVPVALAEYLAQESSFERVVECDIELLWSDGTLYNNGPTKRQQSSKRHPAETQEGIAFVFWGAFRCVHW